jgi:uracil DNA glycosylase
VRHREPSSHEGRGWKHFTSAVIRAVNTRAERVVLVLRGACAGKKEELIDASRHVVNRSAHASPYPS